MPFTLIVKEYAAIVKLFAGGAMPIGKDLKAKVLIGNILRGNLKRILHGYPASTLRLCIQHIQADLRSQLWKPITLKG
jgi:hypothetical protein